MWRYCWFESDSCCESWSSSDGYVEIGVLGKKGCDNKDEEGEESWRDELPLLLESSMIVVILGQREQEFEVLEVVWMVAEWWNGVGFW